MKPKILITSALPYANGPLHFGHMAGAYLPADCYARFMRLQGADVLFISGSDEYGMAITLSAEQAGRTCQEHVDIYHAINQDFFKKFNISFDHFSRTTCKEHAPLVQQFFQDLYERGHVEARKTMQLFSKAEGRFLADRYVIGTCPKCGFEEARGDECGKCGASYEATDLISPRSKITGSQLELKETTHWFLLFDHFKNELQAFLSAHPLWKENVRAFAQNYVDEIHPRAITRDLEWGVAVPLPEAKHKVFYVWFDAPIGYISATQEWANKINESEKWKEYWLDPKTKYVQFVGKDNIPFHAIFFPAMIMGQKFGYKQVDDLVANEFYHLQGRQFSKSAGWTIDLERFFARFQTDQIRFTIAATAPESKDSEFTWQDFQMIVNTQLVGKFGNFINRVLTFLQNHCDSKIPARGELEVEDRRFLNAMKAQMIAIEESYKEYHLRRVTQQMMELAQIGNAYFDLKAPWKAKKEPKLHSSMETTLSLCMECIKLLALVASPLIPESAEKIWQMIGQKDRLEKRHWQEIVSYELMPGYELPKPVILFQKVEDEMVEKEIEQLTKLMDAKIQSKEEIKPEVAYLPLKSTLSIEDFSKIDLRVGVVLQAEKVEKSKKLLKLEVDLGFEKRTILSGIALHCKPEQLLGKKVIVVANLKPAKLMGIESQGMILAGSYGDNLELVNLQHLPAGSIVS